MKFRDLDRVLRENGFEVVPARGKGSHRYYERHIGERTYAFSIPFHGANADIKPGTLRSIIRRSGLDRNLFR